MDKIDILLSSYEDARDELKQRITQRDNLSIQFTVIALSLITLAFTTKRFLLILLLPWIGVYYTYEIYSSYAIHERLVTYIREEIESRLSSYLGGRLWEQYCSYDREMTQYTQIGSRKVFFTVVMMLLPGCSLAVYFTNKTPIPSDLTVVILSLICQIAAYLVYASDRDRIVFTGDNKLALRDYINRKTNTDEKRPAVFIDRDGTLNVDKVMAYKLKDLELQPGARAFVTDAHKAGYLVIILTNQSGIAKGNYSIRQMHIFNLVLRFRLKHVDAIYFCPHLRDTGCRCRKPGTGMVERACKDFNIDLEKSVMVGDQVTDILTGVNSNIGRNILVKTGIYHSDPLLDLEGLSYETCDSLDEIHLLVN